MQSFPPINPRKKRLKGTIEFINIFLDIDFGNRDYADR